MRSACWVHSVLVRYPVRGKQNGLSSYLQNKHTNSTCNCDLFLKCLISQNSVILLQNTQSQPVPPVIDHSSTPNPSTSKPLQFYNPAYRSHHPTQLPPPPPPPPAHGNNYPVPNHPMNNNFRQPVSQPQLHNNNSNNGYHVQPPPPPPPPAQNRYGYAHPEGGQHQPWPAPSHHSYPDNRYQPYSDVRDNRGTPYGDGRGFRAPMHCEFSIS